MIAPVETGISYLLANDDTRKAMEEKDQGLGAAGNSAFIFNPFSFTQNVLDNDYKSAALEGSKIFLPMNNAAGHATALGLGAYGLFNENGLPKTWNYLQNGDYGKAALSGAGDAFNALMTYYGFRGARGDAKPLVDAAQKAYKNRNYYLGYANDYLFNRAAMREAMENGTYIYDRDSYIRNVLPLMRNFRKGQEHAVDNFFDLTGYQYEPIKVRTVHGSRMPKNTGAYYSYRDKTIAMPVTKRHSNIARSASGDDVFAGGHEQAHANNDAIREATKVPTRNPIKRLFVPYTYNPALGVRHIGTDYFIPNKKHPIAAQFFDDFMKVSEPHGRHPEETWSNFQGYRAARQEGYNSGGLDFGQLNQKIEGVPVDLSYDFLSNYIQYLKNTYNH